MLLSNSSHSLIEAAQNCVMKLIVAAAADRPNTVTDHLDLQSIAKRLIFKSDYRKSKFSDA